MTTDVISVDDVTPLRKVDNILETRGIKSVPVMRAGRLVGIVSRANLVQALATEPEEPTLEVSSTDREIREMVMGELAGHAKAFASATLSFVTVLFTSQVPSARSGRCRQCGLRRKPFLR
ncbi:hypothetical protein PTKU46_80040 [Paraburkholderia terrae]|uniref:CBS domain-containing protein n=1 Tax=Paraburkholderia terrae TaxID=311230 RepID=UPI0030DFFA93